MKSNLGKTRVLVYSAMAAALCCAATLVVTIPLPGGGYLNLGDTAVLLSGYLLGPVWGAAAAGIGTMLADLLAGFTIYAPATLVIKALMAALCALVYRSLGGKAGALVIGGCAAEAVMVAGYCGYEALLAHQLAAGLAGIPFNLIQAAFGLTASTLGMLALGRKLPKNAV